MKGDEAKTACQTACAADAIVFGNSHDKESSISKVRAENTQRGFHVLEQLHVLPDVTYLAKIRNTDEIDAHWGGEHGEEHAATGGEHKTGEEHKADSTLPSVPKTEASH